ncbi:UNVERIFIED_CONTAM: hypothetical protein Sradi_7151400 [Sesamum radiatum]|uniref:Uncharacterized protein n=1 Tax=Sesamum radiatum TaxID=300843 RepID=A0AAW2IVG6_SESRA
MRENDTPPCVRSAERILGGECLMIVFPLSYNEPLGNQPPTARRGCRPSSELTPCELAASDLAHRSQVSQLARSQRTRGQRPGELAPSELTGWRGSSSEHTTCELAICFASCWRACDPAHPMDLFFS